ncbi:ABC-2 type transport system permease protein, partial [Phenoliferia sp. Uapishka_3]
MSYNGVGLSTPRGSGTNGHITRNLSNLRPREKFDDRADAKDLYTHRAPDAGILEHERRRRVEVKCLELEVSLQDDGVEEDLVAAQVSALREKLLAQSANANGTERERGSIKSHERHELGQAKALQNERLRLAMGISKDHVEGLAFDREAQAQIRIQKQEEREKAREERTKIEVQLKIDREKALKEREILRKKDDEAIANAKRMHDKRLLDEGLARQQRAQADMRKMDEELDARRAPAGGERDSLDRPAAFDRLPARDEPLPYEGRRPRSPPSRRDDSPPPRSAHSSSRRSPPRDSDRNSRRRDYSPRRGDSPRRRDDSPRGRNESPPARRQRSPTPPFRRRLPTLTRTVGGSDEGAVKALRGDFASGNLEDWLLAAFVSSCAIMRIYEARLLQFTTWSAVEVREGAGGIATDVRELTNFLTRQVLLLAILTSVPYLTFPTPSALFSSTVVLPSLVGVMLLLSSSAHLGGVVLAVLRVLVVGVMWSHIRITVGETRDPRKLLEVVSRLSMFSFVLTTTFYASLSIAGLHTTPLSHAPSWDVVAIVLYPILTGISFLCLLLILASAPITATYAAVINLPLRNFLVFIFGAWVGQGGARTHRLRVWLGATYFISLLWTFTIVSLPTSLRLPSDDFSKPLRKVLRYLPFVPFGLWIASLTLSSSLSPCIILGDVCTTASTFFGRVDKPGLDIVIAHYDRPLADLKAHVSRLKSQAFARSRDVRVIVYDKGETPTSDFWEGLNLNPYKDEVIKLDNVGREGATYFQHILSRYNATATSTSSSSVIRKASTPVRKIAVHTLFIQSHLSWDWIALRRLDVFLPETGFLSLGPYRVNECGYEKGGGNYAGVETIWGILRGRKCDRQQLSTWSGQFIVSKRRIMNVPYEAYQEMDNLLEVSFTIFLSTLPNIQ